MMRRRTKAFTLIEVAVVIAMVGIIGAAAAGVCSLVLQTMKNTRTLATLGVRAQQPMLYVQTELQRAGGNGVTGSAAIVVENDCAARGELPDCNHTDRVNVYTAIQGPVCKARKIAGTDRYQFLWAQGGCCLRTEDFVGHLMLQTLPTAANPRWRPIYAESDETDGCSFIVEDMLPEALLPPGSMTMADTSFVDAVLIEARTFYVDPADHVLWMYLDNDKPAGPGQPTVGLERARVADNIFDFQMALGIDENFDGQYSTPEWAFLGSAAVPAKFNKQGPGLVWFTMVTGLETKTGHGSSAVRSPLMGPTKAIGGQSSGLRDYLLRSTSLHVAPLNGTLGPGFSFTSSSPTGGP